MAFFASSSSFLSSSPPGLSSPFGAVRLPLPSLRSSGWGDGLFDSRVAAGRRFDEGCVDIEIRIGPQSTGRADLAPAFGRPASHGERQGPGTNAERPGRFAAPGERSFKIVSWQLVPRRFRGFGFCVSTLSGRVGHEPKRCVAIIRDWGSKRGAPLRVVALCHTESMRCIARAPIDAARGLPAARRTSEFGPMAFEHPDAPRAR